MMTSRLQDFFRQERNRVFEPDADFIQHVMVRVRAQDSVPQTLWDMALGAARPIVAIAVCLLFILLAIETFVPVIPRRGMIEAYLSPQVSASENLFYADTQSPPSDELLEPLILGSPQ